MMKEKLVYFIFGALCMLAGTQLVNYIGGKDRTVSLNQSTGETQNVARSPEPNTPTEQAAKQIPSAEESGDELAMQETTESENYGSFALSPEKQEELQSMMRKIKLQKLKAEFASLFVPDNPKLEQLTLLSDAKMQRDEKLMMQYNSAASMEEAMALQDLMGKPFDELSPDQQRKMQAYSERGDKMAEQLEQSRIEFEDEVKNLLNTRELDQFKEHEQAAAQRAHERHLDAIQQNMLIDSESINNYQRGQVERIIADVAGRSLPDLPIGISINNSPFINNAKTDEVVANMYLELERLLGTDYVKRARSRPFMMGTQ